MEILVPIIIVPTVFATLFGVAYIAIRARNTERLALIEKGENAEIFNQRATKYPSLRAGLFLGGCGIGVFLGSVIAGNTNLEPVAGYFGMILLFGGLGLLLYHMIENKAE